MIAGPLPARFLEYFSRLGLFTFAFGYVGGLAPANIGLGILLMAFLGKCISSASYVYMAVGLVLSQAMAGAGSTTARSATSWLDVARAFVDRDKAHLE